LVNNLNLYNMQLIFCSFFKLLYVLQHKDNCLNYFYSCSKNLPITKKQGVLVVTTVAKLAKCLHYRLVPRDRRLQNVEGHGHLRCGLRVLDAVSPDDQTFGKNFVVIASSSLRRHRRFPRRRHRHRRRLYLQTCRSYRHGRRWRDSLRENFVSWS